MDTNQLIVGIIGSLLTMAYLKWPKLKLVFLPAALWFFYAGIVSR